MHRLLTAFGFGLVFSGSALANPAMTTTDTEMLESPKPHAHVVQAIPAHAQVDVEDCGPVWCSASWRNIPGYVRANAVVPGAAGPLHGAGPPPRPPVVIAPFGWGWGYGWGPWHHYY